MRGVFPCQHHADSTRLDLATQSPSSTTCLAIILSFAVQRNICALCCFRRKRLKSQVAAVPFNLDPERQPLLPSESHPMGMRSNLEIFMEGPHPGRTSLESTSSAGSDEAGSVVEGDSEPEGEANRRAPAPSGSNSGADGWRCRYLERAENPESTKIAFWDPDTKDDIEVDPIEYLVKRNKPAKHVQTDYWTRHLDNKERARAAEPPREVVIYSDETLCEDAHLDIPLQLKHITTNPVIPSSLADQPCAALGVDRLLKNLNEVLRTSYSLDTPGLLLVLEECIEREDDFGTAYGRLRRFWFGDFEGLPAHLAELEQKDCKMRADALDERNGLVKKGATIPRRVWDMYSNRVLPIWVLHQTTLFESIVWAISHSWMAEGSRRYVLTPINGLEWCVPLPTDTTLDRIRIELLNLGAQYVWLDVLCLRQEDESRPEMEDTRKREWMLDVPTIGYIYWVWNIVTYFEGLGRPFRISDITSPRHWLNRAWTLQETVATTFIGGLTPESPFPPNAKGLDATAKQFYTEYAKMIRDVYRGGNLLHLIQIMDKRSAWHEVDKIAGLAYLTGSDALPLYIRNEDDEAAQAEAAWAHLVRTMKGPSPSSLIFLYPAPGDWEHTWMPTWRQLKSGAPPLPHAMFDAGVWLKLLPNPRRLDRARILRLCTIQGLGTPNDDDQQRCRRGTLTVEVNDRKRGSRAERFGVTAHHQYPIPDNQRYTLVGLRTWGGEQDFTYWTVFGIRTSSGVRRRAKVSVLEMEDEDDRKRLDRLGLARLDPESKELYAEALKKYIYGGHVAEYMESPEEEDDERFKKQPSTYLADGIGSEDIEEISTNAYTAIGKDPTSKLTEKTKDREAESLKHKLKRLTLEERKARIAAKIEAFKAATGTAAEVAEEKEEKE
ncbi:hypothetical protein NM688_g3200 [Phlebia brevispora]|uniref:Uncharacterized protein n=1 Tax=Phlebia brevispora TaxID=194682 RepID=A0ACC1T6C4_9APHY|nr:hypothetical protein NM688_g3200 [Phlebia brevispora]